jgi:hypothetical protein
MPGTNTVFSLQATASISRIINATACKVADFDAIGWRDEVFCRSLDAGLPFRQNALTFRSDSRFIGLVTEQNIIRAGKFAGFDRFEVPPTTGAI